MNRNISAIILTILAIGLYFTVTKGVIADANIVRASNDEYKTAIENSKTLLQVRDQVLADYNRLSIEDRAKLDKIVPKSVDNIRLIIDLNNVALRYGFSLKGIAVNTGSSANTNQAGQGDVTQSAISTPTLSKVSVSFGLSAPYQQFISFLQELEASLRILDLNSLSVTASDNGIYEWKLDLSTYWLHSQ
jgi:Tfp pilus assembly protein PilO